MTAIVDEMSMTWDRQFVVHHKKKVASHIQTENCTTLIEVSLSGSFLLTTKKPLFIHLENIGTIWIILLTWF